MSTRLPLAIQKVIVATQSPDNVPVTDKHEGIGRIELASIQFKQAESYGENVIGVNPEKALVDLTKLCLETLALYQTKEG